jgi:hypothetical protein
MNKHKSSSQYQVSISLPRSRLCKHLSWKILIGKSGNASNMWVGKLQNKKKVGPVKDFREAVYEGVKSIQMDKERIVWWTFCKHDKNLQLS